MKPIAYSYIRFSKPEQLKGDSLRRQLDKSRKWAAENGFELDESLKDLGVSAFKGIHKLKGAFGRFLKLVEDGKIKKGSYLLIEKLDRISRQDVLEALEQFISIINAGITIVTMDDKMEYSRESITENWSQLIISITYMAKGNAESKDKSDRIKEAWENKRKKVFEATGPKLTKKAPIWLTMSEDRTEFKPIPEACEAVELIFRLKLQGYGSERILGELISREPKLWSPPKIRKNQKTVGWRKSYIEKILKSRAVIGEYTPCTLVNGKRIPQAPIEGYYPEVIDKQLFYNVQDLMSRNSELNGRGGGKIGKASNLFTHVVRCGTCKAPMHFIDKGKPPKGGLYLRCYRSIMRNGCDAKPVRYDEFEHLFFHHIKAKMPEILSRVSPHDDQKQKRLNDIAAEIVSNKQQIKELGKSFERLTEHIYRSSNAQTREGNEIVNRKLASDREQLIKRNGKLLEEKAKLEKQEDELEQAFNKVNDIYDLLASTADEQERIDLRHKINQEIKGIFEWINIYPLREPYERIRAIQDDADYVVLQVMKSKYIEAVNYKLKGVDLPTAEDESGDIPFGLIKLKYIVSPGDEEFTELIQDL
jgi:DNA invertase Pin-like site-specific DNA recombinase